MVEQSSKSSTSTTIHNISQASDIVKKQDFSAGILSKSAEEPWNDRGKGGMISIKIPTFSLTKERYYNIIKWLTVKVLIINCLIIFLFQEVTYG